MADEMNNKELSGEEGNVLFLILIAVALFAALSYAVTQSSRTGGGDTGENALIYSAQVTQYPASVRTSIIRMLVSGNVNASELYFTKPEEFAAGCAANVDRCVFHPSGGSATFSPAPPEVVTGTTPQRWNFNSQNEINLVGTSVGGDAASATSADIIAFLPNVTEPVCRRINEQLGIGDTIPGETGIVFDEPSDMDHNTAGIAAAGAGPTIGDDVAAFDGQPYGCFSQGGVNVYYHVLIEQ